ncbi:SDR family NAD(P)-dependent oxidoreductase [Rhodococcus sp. NPDC057135]|uniref:SDR family NAD(P)-dependent oxidoreductase n=1 Tax=Rhodococcus sp. NPDC057135 TaxID=3346028 RepID=UPI0036452DA2
MTRKVAIVTGGASGIGLATCKRFVELGWNVISADLSHQPGGAATESDTRTVGVRVDVTDEGDIRRLRDVAEEAFGRVDTVVTSAGTADNAPIRQTTPDRFRRTLELNLVSTFGVIREFVDLLAGDSGGSVVTIASVSGLRGSVDRAAYSASKGGVVALTAQLAIELASEGIRVNCVAPGSTLTPLARRAQSPEMQSAILQSIPLRRYADPSEIAEVVTFVAGPTAGFVTGQTWTVDGGQSMTAGWNLQKERHES